MATPDNEDYLLMIADHGTVAHVERLVRGYRKVKRIEALEAENQRHDWRSVDWLVDDDGSRFVDAHHVHHWADGGETRLDNLVLLCRHHHRLVHERGCGVRMNRTGDAVFTDPGGEAIPTGPDTRFHRNVAAPGMRYFPSPLNDLEKRPDDTENDYSCTNKQQRCTER